LGLSRKAINLVAREDGHFREKSISEKSYPPFQKFMAVIKKSFFIHPSIYLSIYLSMEAKNSAGKSSVHPGHPS